MGRHWYTLSNAAMGMNGFQHRLFTKTQDDLQSKPVTGVREQTKLQRLRRGPLFIRHRVGQFVALWGEASSSTNKILHRSRTSMHELLLRPLWAKFVRSNILKLSSYCHHLLEWSTTWAHPYNCIVWSRRSIVQNTKRNCFIHSKGIVVELHW